jgi:ribosome-binding factor A
MSVKTDRLASSIVRELSQIFREDIKESALNFVTITEVKVNGDASQAKIYVTFLGGENKIDAGLKALNRAKGHIRSQLARRLKVRHTPNLNFVYDESTDYGNKISRILDQVK